MSLTEIYTNADLSRLWTRGGFPEIMPYTEVRNMIVKTDLDACRRDLESFVGRRIRLTSNGGRKRTIVHEGVLDHCYPNVFTVRCTRRDSNTGSEIISYSYVDILTKVVEIATVPAKASVG